MAKIRIVSDGTVVGTRVYAVSETETSEIEISDHVVGVHWEMSAVDKLARATIEIIVAEANILTGVDLAGK